MHRYQRFKQKAINAAFYIRNYGIVRFCQELHYQISNQYHERRLGVNTAGMIKAKEFGFQNQDCKEYIPMGYRYIYAVLKKIPLPSSQVVFLDYGTGKGRAAVAAATFPYKRVLGVEVVDELIEVARHNLERMNHKKAEQVRLYHENAATFCLPPEVNVIYFFNPFEGQVLQDVINQICDSYTTHPREMYIIFLNNDHFEKCIFGQGWIKRIYHTKFYPSYTCGLYKIG